MKKTLLIAAAALVAGVISSEAQVYSANIVGYVNVPAPAGKFILVANPLDTGNNVLSNVLQNVPGATTVNIWNGTSFSLCTYSALSHSWKQGTVNADNTPLPPGAGFFINASSAFTNTFVGNVLPVAGGSVTNVLGTLLVPVGSLTPYADVVTNAATFNLQVAGASTLQQWSVPNQSFSLFTYSSLAHTWKQGSIVTNPVVGVAEGFFIQSSSPTNWVQTLQ